MGPSVPSATSLPSLASFTTSPRPTPPTVPSSGPRLRPWRLTSTRPLLVLSRLVRPRPRLSNQCESAADNVFKIISGKRQKIADNYLSFKAYAVSAVDKVTDYTGKGKGRNLSSIGDMLMTVGALAAVKAPKAEGLGFGGKVLPPVFSGKNIKVKGA